ncbi:MAG: signal peptidase I [Pararhodobacter sp.]
MSRVAAMKDSLRETVKAVFWALLIAGAFRSFVYQPFWIPSGSMKETLLVGDFLFVNKMAYGFSRHSCPFGLCPFEGRILASMPERGDIVVFRHPVSGEDYVKRLIGLPGDRIQVRNGVLYINGTVVPREPAEPFVETYARQGSARVLPRCQNSPVRPGDDCIKARAFETLPNGLRYAVLDITRNGSADNTEVFTVPEGHFFFMGDNRDNSIDSRFAQEAGGVGFVPFENLIGRADRVIFSSAGSSLLAFWTWRPDRFLHALHP